MSSDIKLFTNFLKRKQNLVCITGAGISTASGIPDYRGINGSYSRGHRPIQHHEFITHEKFRKRYWVRSMGGYKHLKDAKPNLGHESLVKLFHLGIVKKIITQNVDNLHTTAAATVASNPIPIINLHGVIHEIRCLSCHEIFSRNNFQNSLETLNPDIADMLKTADHGSESVRADGDMNIENVDLTKFQVPSCPSCHTGMLKPNVVFFGDNVPKDVTQKAVDFVKNADGLLVVGSSLEVLSAYRFVRLAANEFQIPIAIINQGITRAEREGLPIEFKSEMDCSKLLDAVVKELTNSNSI